jgi:hypothetical protein
MITIAAVIGLLLYADFVAIGLLSAPLMSMYAAVAAAVGLTITTLVYSFIGKRKSNLAIRPNIPFQTAKIVSQAPIKVHPIVSSPTVGTQNRVKNFETVNTERKYLPVKNPPVKEIKKQTIQQPAQLKVEKTVPTQREAKEETKGKTTCSICSKEFSQPLLMADYSVPNQPDLIAHCPYCFKPLSSKQKSTTNEEAWKKYV